MYKFTRYYLPTYARPKYLTGWTSTLVEVPSRSADNQGAFGLALHFFAGGWPLLRHTYPTTYVCTKHVPLISMPYLPCTTTHGSRKVGTTPYHTHTSCQQILLLQSMPQIFFLLQDIHYTSTSLLGLSSIWQHHPSHPKFKCVLYVARMPPWNVLDAQKVSVKKFNPQLQPSLYIRAYHGSWE